MVVFSILFLFISSPLISGKPPSPATTPSSNNSSIHSRDEKFLSIFQIVKFANDACSATDGNTGTCLTAAECTSSGGAATGTCASGFGVCCVAVIDPCTDSEPKLNSTLLVNPGYPSTVAAASCTVGTADTARQTTQAATYTYLIPRFSSTSVQMRLDFIMFEIGSPSSGDCTNDTLTISGADTVTSKILPATLCGILTGQHVYLSIQDLAYGTHPDHGHVTVTINLATVTTQKWQIMIRQYESSQVDYLAPRGCLQYFREDAATLSTFNNNGGDGELLNDQMYSICIAQNDDYCDVSLTATSFELTGSSGSCSDKLGLGTSIYCGSTFGVVTWNYTGPYCIPVLSDSNNDEMVAGFQISYQLLGC